MNPLFQSLIGFRSKLSENGAAADDAMRAAGLTEWAANGLVGFERIRRLAQGRAALAKQASGIGKVVAKVAGPLGVALEAGNTAWLASDPDKRSRVEADFDANAKKPAVERMVEGALNATDTLYATGKSIYDTGKTNESIQRSQMDEVNNDLLRKIAAHEAKLAKERKNPNRNKLADMVTSSLNITTKARP